MATVVEVGNDLELRPALTTRERVGMEAQDPVRGALLTTERAVLLASSMRLAQGQ